MVCERRVPFRASALFENSKHLPLSLLRGSGAGASFYSIAFLAFLTPCSLHPASDGKRVPCDVKGRRAVQDGQFVSKLDSEDGSKKRKTLRETNDVVLDRALHLWFSQRRSKGDPISGPLLCEKALIHNEKLGGSADFKASTGWLKMFKSRHGIREQQIEVESFSRDKNSAQNSAMEWYKQQSEFCPTQLLLLKRIRDLAAKK
ncbi:jerky-like protein [Trichonephila clavipes]|nr:jerky-like protein [Trichonephila clavipes]